MEKNRNIIQLDIFYIRTAMGTVVELLISN